MVCHDVVTLAGVGQRSLHACVLICGPIISNADSEPDSTPSVPLPAPELLHVLMLPDLERVGAIQSYWGNPKTGNFGELLIDCAEERTLRAVLVGILREGERLGPS